MTNNVTIKVVRSSGDWYAIEHSDCGGFGVEKANWPEHVPAPKTGDVLTVYPDTMVGSAVTGIDCNGVRVFMLTPEEIEARRLAGIAEYDYQRAKGRYEALRDQRRLRERGAKLAAIETLVIGGLSPDYENACQVMLKAGLEHVAAHGLPDGNAAWDAFGDLLDKACPGGGASGAMVGAVCHHVRAITTKGHAAWLAMAEPSRRFMWDGTSGSCVAACKEAK